MASKKRTIGVARRNIAASPAPPVPTRTITKRAAPRRCPACTGEFKNGMWVHSARCPETVVLWFAHDHRVTDWAGVYRCCPYQCDGTRFPSGVTHSQDCAFWNGPLDHEILQTLVDAQLELDSLG